MEVCTPLAEVPLGPAPDLEHESITHEAVLRSSMMTVRLSNSQSVAEGKPSSEADDAVPNKKAEHTRVRSDENEPSGVAPEEVVVLGHEDAALRDGEESMPKNARPASVPASGTIAGSELHPEKGSKTLHVRTGSIDSNCSSASSAHVDWEVLDKNEEQEQKDEGSDDVSQ